MTVSIFDPRRISAGNGVTLVFDAPYVVQAADLQVNLVDATTGASTTQVLNTDYTLAGVGNQAGSTVTMLVAPPAGFNLERLCNPFQSQETHFIEGEEEPASSKEATLDRMVMMIQALTMLIVDVDDAALQTPYPEIGAYIPSIADRKGKALTFDPTTGAPTATSLSVASFFFLLVPPVAEGLDGDVAIETPTGDVYQKIAGVWTFQGNITGPTGARGSLTFTGPAAPGVIGGQLNGDNYLQTGGAGLGDYYQLIAGVWTFQANLRGASGAGTGDVVGPAGVTDGRFVLFDGVTGKLVKQHTGAPGALAVKNSVAGATEIDVGSISYDRHLAAAIATTAEVNAGTASKLVNAAVARASLAPSTPAYAASVALDLDTGCEFDVGTLTGSINLAAPTNGYVGQPVIVWLTQDATGGRAITVTSSSWKLGTFTPSTAANKVDMIKGVVKSIGPVVIHGSYQAATA